MNKSTKINEELRPDELEKAATDLAYSMPNHTKYDDKKGPTDAQIVKAMKKYFKDLYQHSTISQKKQAIKIVKNVLSEGKLNEISTGAGLNDVIQGRTSSIEGYTLSKELADKILFWIETSPYGRRYGKQIMKGRFASLFPMLRLYDFDKKLPSKLKGEWKKLLAKHNTKSEGLNEAELNKKDVSYQLSIDYTGRTKPKVTKLNNKQLNVFYGYKVNPKDVIKSIKKLNPSIKLKHKAWKDNMSGGGVHSFIIESKLNEGVPFPQTEPNEFAYLDYKKWAYKYRGQYKKDIQKAGNDANKIFKTAERWWEIWAKKTGNEEFSNIRGNKFGRALIKMMWNDNLIFDKKSHKITKLKEGKEIIDFASKLNSIINEKTSLWKRFDKLQKLRTWGMDLEDEMRDIAQQLKQTHRDMEQEAEPEGGPKATKYGKEIEKLEKQYKKKKAEFKKIMAKIDKIEQF